MSHRGLVLALQILDLRVITVLQAQLGHFQGFDLGILLDLVMLEVAYLVVKLNVSRLQLIELSLKVDLAITVPVVFILADFEDHNLLIEFGHSFLRLGKLFS